MPVKRAARAAAGDGGGSSVPRPREGCRCPPLGIKSRFASKENIHATARLERFWRTLKDITRLRAPYRPADFRELERRLSVFLTHYVFFRPHRGPGMDGATPAEIFAGREPAVKSAKSPPRGRQGEGPKDLGLTMSPSVGDQELPVPSHTPLVSPNYRATEKSENPVIQSNEIA